MLAWSQNQVCVCVESFGTTPSLIRETKEKKYATTYHNKLALELEERSADVLSSPTESL